MRRYLAQLPTDNEGYLVDSGYSQSDNHTTARPGPEIFTQRSHQAACQQRGQANKVGQSASSSIIEQSKEIYAHRATTVESRQSDSGIYITIAY